MIYIAGVDVGNNTTEVAIAEVSPGGKSYFLSSATVRTVGIKGTIQNVMGVIEGLDTALMSLPLKRSDISLILLNEATPVIGDVAMETITETVITESAMIGHNPGTPGGEGLGTGVTVSLESLKSWGAGAPCTVVVSGNLDFHQVATQLNQAAARGVQIAGAILQNDDGVLVANRLSMPIPIVDEVEFIDMVPLGMPAAVEVAAPGRSIQKLSNPFDIATLFDLDPEETRRIVPIARALTGIRSAVHYQDAERGHSGAQHPGRQACTDWPAPPGRGSGG